MHCPLSLKFFTLTRQSIPPVNTSANMRYLLPFILLSFFLTDTISSQTCQDVSVEIRADVQADPPIITLNWIPNSSATNHFVYRKLKTGNSWGSVIGNLPGTAKQFVDTTVERGVSYEYRILRQAATFTGYGYINAGIEIPAEESRGIIILLIDSTFADSLAFEIGRLVDDLEGDGWRVRQANVSRTTPVTEVKALIVSLYNNDPAKTKALFLLGRIPVPYSGEINVDGHADHTGAYPADVYYADINGTWTDNLVNNISAGDPRNRNIPEDGKFDQGLIPSDIELQTGRVDFYNMPAFAASEQELLRRYLDKDHAYRQKEFTIDHRALVDDNFGYFGAEAFAASGWKNFGPLVGPENVVTGDYIPDMTNASFLWSYGCGGGWYQGAGGVGSTGELANADLQSVFTMLFGSYFGDWDSQNNFLRAALAQGKTLTNVWSGRPHWEFHHMGLGETIGYSTRLSQNNNALYTSNFGGRVVHMALMGDPTLRNDVVAPPSNVTVGMNTYHADISWSPSVDTVLGYHLYVRTDDVSDFTRVNETIIADTFFTDSCLGAPGDYTYMVRAIRLEQSPSGTYYNLSQGRTGSVVHTEDPTVTAQGHFTQEGNVVSFINDFPEPGSSILWLFGDGESSTENNPVHIYNDGTFTATLIVSNECNADTAYFLIDIFTSTNNPDDHTDLTVYPNPAKNSFHIVSQDDGNKLIDLSVTSITGRQAFSKNAVYAGDEINIDLPPGIYFLQITIGTEYHVHKLVID